MPGSLLRLVTVKRGAKRELTKAEQALYDLALSQVHDYLLEEPDPPRAPWYKRWFRRKSE